MRLPTISIRVASAELITPMIQTEKNSMHSAGIRTDAAMNVSLSVS